MKLRSLFVLLAAISLALVAFAPLSSAATGDADLEVSISDDPDPTSVGGTLTYTLYVNNFGPDTAVSTVLTDTLPSSVTFTSSNPPSPTCTSSSGTVTCQLGDITAGSYREVTIVVTPNQAGFINNSATVSSSTNDPDTSTNSATEDTQVNAQPTADLSLSLSDNPDPVFTGRNLTYSIDVYNNGPDQASNVTVTDTLPSSVTFASSQPPSPTCTNSGGTVSCSLGDLAVSGTRTVTIVVKPSSPGVINDTATVSSGAQDPDTSSDSKTIDTTVNQAPSVLSIVGAKVTEGDSGKRSCTFVVKMKPASGLTVTVHYATANGTAKAPADYAAKSGTLTFSPGTSSRKLPITVKGDKRNESNETFSVKLSAPQNATIGTSKAKCTIVDDD